MAQISVINTVDTIECAKHAEGVEAEAFLFYPPTLKVLMLEMSIITMKRLPMYLT